MNGEPNRMHLVAKELLVDIPVVKVRPLNESGPALSSYEQVWNLFKERDSEYSRAMEQVQANFLHGIRNIQQTTLGHIDALSCGMSSLQGETNGKIDELTEQVRRLSSINVEKITATAMADVLKNIGLSDDIAGENIRDDMRGVRKFMHNRRDTFKIAWVTMIKYTTIFSLATFAAGLLIKLKVLSI